MATYELKHISDLLKIPAERRNAALDELKLALPFYATQVQELQRLHPDDDLADLIPKLVWEDNGETTVTARYAGGVVATLTLKKEPRTKSKSKAAPLGLKLPPIYEYHVDEILDGDLVQLRELKDQWVAPKTVSHSFVPEGRERIYGVTSENYYTKDALLKVKVLREPMIGDPVVVCAGDLDEVHLITFIRHARHGAKATYKLSNGSECTANEFVVAVTAGTPGVPVAGDLDV